MNNFTRYLNNHIFTKKYSEKFFNKKRILFISIFIVIFVLALFLTFWGLKINLSDIWNYFNETFHENNGLSLFFCFLIILFPLTRFFYIFSYIRPIMIENNIHLSWIEYVALFCKIVVINAITPFASGSEPYTVYWLRSRGLSLNTASMVSICNGVCSGICEIIITIPSFILVSLRYNELANVEMGLVVYWFIFCGLLINFFVLFVFLLTAFSSKSQYYISVFFNFILRKIHLNYLTKDQIRNKYLINHEFKQELFKMFKNVKYISILCIMYVIFTIYYYFTFYFSLEALNIDQINFAKNISTLFNVINVSVTANNFIPIPGAEGTMQISLITLTSIFDQSINIGSIYINNVVGFWRIMTSYIPLIISLGCVLVYYFLKIYIIKNSFNKDDFSIS